MIHYIVYCIVYYKESYQVYYKERYQVYYKESYPDDVLTAAADVDKKTVS
jgi:hypothetical protein